MYDPTYPPSRRVLNKYIPKEAYDYAPTRDDAVLVAEGSMQRMIFHATQTYDPQEQKHLEAFRKFI